MQREVLAIHRKVYGNEHRRVAVTLHSLADILRKQHKLAEAETAEREAVDILKKTGGNRADEMMRFMRDLCDILQDEGEPDKAAAAFRELAELYGKAVETGDADACNAYAWFLATCDNSSVRNGQIAITFAEKAVAATGRTNAVYLDTLAAACAENGQFEKAVGVQKESIALLQTDKEKKDGFRLSLYEQISPTGNTISRF